MAIPPQLPPINQNQLPQDNNAPDPWNSFHSSINNLVQLASINISVMSELKGYLSFIAPYVDVLPSDNDFKKYFFINLLPEVNAVTTVGDVNNLNTSIQTLFEFARPALTPQDIIDGAKAFFLGMQGMLQKPINLVPDRAEQIGALQAINDVQSALPPFEPMWNAFSNYFDALNTYINTLDPQVILQAVNSIINTMGWSNNPIQPWL